VTYSRHGYRSLEAAEALAKDGLDVEVIDLRTLKRWISKPLWLRQEDWAPGMRQRSVRKHRLHQRGHDAGQRAGL